jgi:hypothetical protein
MLNSTRNLTEERLDRQVENKPEDHHVTEAGGGLGIAEESEVWQKELSGNQCRKANIRLRQNE